MKKATCLRLTLLITLFPYAVGFTICRAQGTLDLFNGKDLSGWIGKEEFWKVENGTIIGETTKDKPTKGNTFLIWKGGQVRDFEFSCQVTFKGNNSGVQYRSEAVGDLKDCVLRGYQADLHPKQEYFGILRRKVRQAGNYRQARQKADARGDKEVKSLGSVGDKTELTEPSGTN